MMVDLKVSDLYQKVRIRLHGVDTPDAYKSAPDTPAGQVRDLVRAMTKDRECTLIVHSQSRGGWKAEVIVHTPEGKVNLNEHLQKQGYIYQRETR